MDEAMHPLALLSVGMYGETLPNQDGAPVRMVIPWKYGFKSIKSLVKIKFVKDSAADHLEHHERPRIRLLFQRESERGPSALEPGEGSPPAGIFQKHEDPDVQRLRRPGGQSLQRHGPEEKFLNGYSNMNSILTSKWTKVVVFLVCLIPAGILIWDAFTGQPELEPHAVSGARHRRLDAAVPGHHAVRSRRCAKFWASRN